MKKKPDPIIETFPDREAAEREAGRYKRDYEGVVTTITPLHPKKRTNPYPPESDFLPKYKAIERKLTR